MANLFSPEVYFCKKLKIRDPFRISDSVGTKPLLRGGSQARGVLLGAHGLNAYGFNTERARLAGGPSLHGLSAHGVNTERARLDQALRFARGRALRFARGFQKNACYLEGS